MPRRRGSSATRDRRCSPWRSTCDPRRRFRQWIAATADTFGGIDGADDQLGRPAGRAGDRRSTTRRGRTLRSCCCSARCAWSAPPCRHEGPRRRRDPHVHVVVGQGADPEPRAVDGASRVGVGARQDAGDRAGAVEDPRQSDHPGPHRYRSRAALDEVNAKKQGISVEEAKAQSRSRRFRWAATARPRSSAASARFCSRMRRRT